MPVVEFAGGVHIPGCQPPNQEQICVSGRADSVPADESPLSRSTDQNRDRNLGPSDRSLVVFIHELAIPERRTRTEPESRAPRIPSSGSARLNRVHSPARRDGKRSPSRIGDERRNDQQHKRNGSRAVFAAGEVVDGG